MLNIVINSFNTKNCSFNKVHEEFAELNFWFKSLFFTGTFLETKKPSSAQQFVTILRLSFKASAFYVCT